MPVELLPHQQEAVRIIAPKSTFMLADAPGLGKTYTALAVARSKRITSRYLSVICPRNVISQWKQACQEILGPELGSLPLIVNYEQLHKHQSRLSQSQMVILDESHFVKNVESARFKAVSRVCRSSSNPDVLALTGTPIFSYPKDLFGQLYCLRKIEANEQRNFLWRYCDPKKMSIRGKTFMDYRGCDMSRMPELKAKFAPYILRRDWKDVGLSMPPLTMTDLEVEPEGLKDHPQYAAASADFEEWYKSSTGRDSTGLEKFTVLRRLLALAKIPAVLEYFEQTDLPAGSKVLVFSDFREPAELLSTAAHKFTSNSFLVEGGQSDSYRQAMFMAFTMAQGPAILCATTDSLNVGVNLQAATRIYFVDLSFKPAAFVQAVHRSWRLGQHSPVSVVRFVAKGTMDDFISKNLLTKQGYMEALGLQNTVGVK